jgi:outer membrane biosynthesis protein TonB
LANIINTYLGNIKMEIFILIGIILAGLVLLLWYRSNKNTKVEEAVIEPKSVIEPEVVPAVVVKEEPVQAKVEEISFTIEETSVVPEVMPEVVKPVKKPKAKKSAPTQAPTPKPKRTRKPKA